MKGIDFSSSPLIQKGLHEAERRRQSQAAFPSSENESVKIPNTAGNIYGNIPPEQLTPEVKAQIHALSEEIRTLRYERIKLLKAARTLENLADTDPLAETYNRRAFFRELHRILSFVERYEFQAALLFFDLNGFKQVNDTFGHSAGDELIKNVAKILKENVRESDIVGRVGGDEFAVLMVKADEEMANGKGQQLIELINDLKLSFEDKMVRISASVGVYAVKAGDKPDEVVARADEAMYSRKASGRFLRL